MRVRRPATSHLTPTGPRVGGQAGSSRPLRTYARYDGPVTVPRTLRLVQIAAILLVIWSGWRPYDRWTWVFELVLGVMGLAVLSLSWRRFTFSNLVYVLAGIHFAILALGAKYTYAEMPLFDWLRDAAGLARNHYDRVGHFAQGFIPAIILRELLIRVVRMRRGVVLSLVCIGLCLGMSAFYEFIEWWIVVLFYPEQGPAWLGMQGDPWDAQWDMFMAFCGATLAILTLSRMHDRSMAARTAESNAE